MRARCTRLAATVTIAAVLLVGCGEDDDSSAEEATSRASDSGSTESADEGNPFAGEPTQEVVKSALAETQELRSVRVRTGAASEGLEVDLWMSTDGRCRGTMKSGPKQQQIRSDGTDYFQKGNLAYWSEATGGHDMGRAMLETLGDKWAKLAKPGNISSTKQLCNPRTYLSALSLNSTAFNSEGEATTLADGTEAVAFSSSTDATVWVSVEDPHRIVRLEHEDGDPVILSELNEPVQAQVPPPGQVVELRKKS